MIELIKTTPAVNVFLFNGEEYKIYSGSDLLWKGEKPATQEERIAFDEAWG